MSIQFTCPSCRAKSEIDETFLGQSGPCWSCGRAVTITRDLISNTPPQPSDVNPNRILKTTLGGGGVGCAIVTIISIVFLLLPLAKVIIYAMIATRAIQAGGNRPLHFLVEQAAIVVIAGLAGLVFGILVMSPTSVLLRNSPARLTRAGLRGAFLGSAVGPIVVLCAQSIPYWIQIGTNGLSLSYEVILTHWTYALISSAVGSLGGLVIAVVIAWLTRRK